MASNEFPTDGVEMSVLLVVKDVTRSREFYVDVLGGSLYREYGGTTAVVNFQSTWLILTTEGEPTEDKPQVSMVVPSDPDKVSVELTIRVPDCRAAYAVLKERGAEFLTPPYDWGHEVRCFFRDPDGHLLEISEAVK